MSEKVVKRLKKLIKARFGKLSRNQERVMLREARRIRKAGGRSGD